ncbi:uncharacterized protein J3R85_005392 [Psidium guajava]|nr:uncharacterized protein J3R85_005392 [Psidium guajava]
MQTENGKSRGGESLDFDRRAFNPFLYRMNVSSPPSFTGEEKWQSCNHLMRPNQARA